MLDMQLADDATTTARRWLSLLESALGNGDGGAVAALFGEDGSWRDLLAFTSDLRTFSGHEQIAKGAKEIAAAGTTTGFAVVEPLSAVHDERFGRGCLQVTFAFGCASGTGRGLARLVEDDAGAFKFWTLLTSLETLKGLRERNGPHRPRGTEYSRGFGRENWLDHRLAAQRFADHNPEVLIVGAGQAGLALGARLTQMGVDNLIVDRTARIGDNWRQRYHSLTLHNVVWTNHLPYLPFPPSFPVFIPKDKLANWFESYADAMELNFWTGTEFLGASRDERRGSWTARLRRDGGMRQLEARHIVVATGVSGIPNVPPLPGLGEFSGSVMHSSRYGEGAAYRGKRALVVGTGNSGHDIAQDLYCSGAEVTIMQRSPTTIVSIEPGALRSYSLYQEGCVVEDSDLLTLSLPYSLMRTLAQRLTIQANDSDREILDALHAVGFETDNGEDGTGWQFKYLRKGGGYYFNVGCSELIAGREIALRHHRDLRRFTSGGAEFSDGSFLQLDLVVLATGYRPMEGFVEEKFGGEVAARLGPVWGFDEQGEMRNVWKRTPQPGLWFIMGSLAHARIFSRYLGMQIWMDR